MSVVPAKPDGLGFLLHANTLRIRRLGALRQNLVISALRLTHVSHLHCGGRVSYSAQNFTIFNARSDGVQRNLPVAHVAEDVALQVRLFVPSNPTSRSHNTPSKQSLACGS